MVTSAIKKAITSIDNKLSNTVYNFGAGPAMLPAAVMRQAREELLNWQGTGISVIEMSHRSDEFIAMAEQSEADLRALLSIPQNYKVLFMQGGASAQFAIIPMNLAKNEDTTDYLYTGHWSGKALNEARRLCKVHVVLSTEKEHFRSLPDRMTWDLNPEATYVYYTANETIEGVEFHSIPDVGEVPLVSDMTSTLLSRPLDVSRFGIIFAGAQKNIGPAGLVTVIIRDDLIGRAPLSIPSLYDYSVQVREKSMANTPPTFSWYMAGLVFRWIREQGGLEVMEKRAKARSQKLYHYIEESGFYESRVENHCRSRMNIPFYLRKEALNETFLLEANKRGLVALKGHRIAGGMRASLYNAMPEEGVDRLIEFMGEFKRRFG